MTSIIHLLEPRRFEIIRSALMGLFKDSKGKLEIREIWSSNNKNGQSLKELLSIIAEKVNELPESNRVNLLLPVYCFDEVTPFFEGVRAFLSQTLPDSLQCEVQSLELHRPVEAKFATGKRGSGALVKTILDFSSQRILILGNSEKAISQLRTLIHIFHFPEKHPKSLAKDIHETFSEYVPNPTGTRVLIGGFGAIYAFLAAFLVNKCIGMTLSFEELFSLILCLFSIICFLCFEGFEDTIIAFSPKRNVVFKTVSWVSFLIVLFGSPFIFFGQVPLSTLFPILRLLTLIILVSCFICCLGDIFFEAGLSKGLTLVLWLTLAAFIFVLPRL